MRRIWAVFVLMWILIGGVSCIRMKHDMTIQPVHVTVEIRVKIDRALDEFFGDLDAKQYEEKKESSEANGGNKDEA
ncbi:MAG: hypothetical protein JXA62_08695 [Candidatus Aminicenantes bacterium]|nr:hypothetical protein [Candidatus Aminicenantes bacterium]